MLQNEFGMFKVIYSTMLAFLNKYHVGKNKKVNLWSHGEAVFFFTKFGPLHVLSQSITGRPLAIWFNKDFHLATLSQLPYLRSQFQRMAI